MWRWSGAVVGDEPLLEHAQAGSGADVRADAEAHPVLDVTGHREQAGGEEGVAGRAVGDGGASGRKPAQLVVGGMHVVGEHRALAQQPGVLVGGDVVARVGEQLAHELDLAGASLTWLVSSTPGSRRSAQAFSIGSLQDTEKRGVTA